jgi:hypothetical protein
MLDGDLLAYSSMAICPFTGLFLVAIYKHQLLVTSPPDLVDLQTPAGTRLLKNAPAAWRRSLRRAIRSRSRVRHQNQELLACLSWRQRTLG